jgi:hypothetical protein
MTSTNTVTENSESFTRRTYNGISAIAREKDGYFNAGKLCRDAGKDFYGFKRGNRWKEIVEYWQKEDAANLLPPIYELKKGYDECKGIYVHKDLIHFVAEFVSLEYTFKVKKIMDSINENNFDKLNKHVEDLQNRNENLVDKAHNNDVRTDINNKKVRIVKIKDEESKIENKYYYGVSVDNKKILRGGELVREFILLAGINIHQHIKRTFEKDYACPKFEERELPDLYDFIESSTPKN